MNSKPFGGGFLQRVSDGSVPLNAKILDFDLFDASKQQKPFVICFPGDASFSSHGANSLCKVVQNMAKTNAIVFGFFYPKKLADRGWFSKDEQQKIATNLFVPFFEKSKQKNKTSEDLADDLEKMVFVTHCQGFEEVCSVLEEAAKLCKKFEFNPEIAFSKIHHVSFEPQTANKTKFGSHVCFYSFNDQNKTPEISAKFFKDGKFGGIDFAKADAQNNILWFLANSFVNSKFLSENQSENIEHSLFVLGGEKKTKFSKKIEDTRILWIRKMFSIAVNNALNGKNLEQTFFDFDSEIENQAQTLFEQNDKILFDEFKLNYNKKMDIQQFLATLGCTEKDILNGKFAIQKVCEKMMQQNMKSKLNFEKSTIPKVFWDNAMQEFFVKTSTSEILLNPQTPQKFLEEERLVLFDGEFSQNPQIKQDEGNLLAFARISEKNAKNAVVVSLNKKGKSKQIFVEPAYDFLPGNALCMDDLNSMLYLNKQGFEMSPQQTRYVLNLATKNGLKIWDVNFNDVVPNKKVFSDEVNFFDDGHFAPQKSATLEDIENASKNLGRAF